MGFRWTSQVKCSLLITLGLATLRTFSSQSRPNRGLKLRRRELHLGTHSLQGLELQYLLGASLRCPTRTSSVGPTDGRIRPRPTLTCSIVKHLSRTTLAMRVGIKQLISARKSACNPTYTKNHPATTSIRAAASRETELC